MKQDFFARIFQDNPEIVRYLETVVIEERNKVLEKLATSEGHETLLLQGEARALKRLAHAFPALLKVKN